MYYVSKRLEISAAHKLLLNYDSKCSNLHGHNWIITVYCRSKELNENGMVCDFTSIKQLIQERLDHKYLNEVFSFNPTSENLAYWLVQQIPQCYKAEVQESEGNVAIYTMDE